MLRCYRFAMRSTIVLKSKQAISYSDIAKMSILPLNTPFRPRRRFSTDPRHGTTIIVEESTVGRILQPTNTAASTPFPIERPAIENIDQLETAARVGDVSVLFEFLEKYRFRPKAVFQYILRTIHQQRLWDTALAVIDYAYNQDILDKATWNYSVDVMISSPLKKEASCLLILMAKQNYRPSDVHITRLMTNLRDSNLLDEALVLVTSLVKYNFPPKQDILEFTVKFCMDSKDVNAALQVVTMMETLLSTAFPVKTYEDMIDFCIREAAYEQVIGLFQKCRIRGVLNHERFISACLHVGDLDMAVAQALDGSRMGRIPNKTTMDALLKALHGANRSEDIHQLLRSTILHDTSEISGALYSLISFNKLGYHDSAVEVFLWGAHCGLFCNGMLTQCAPLYKHILHLSDQHAITNELLFTPPTSTSQASSITLPQLYATIMLFNSLSSSQSFEELLSYIDTSIPHVIEYTNQMLASKHLAPWEVNADKRYDVAALQYSCCKILWFNIILEVIQQSMLCNYPYNKLVHYLTKYFDRTTINIAAWQADVIQSALVLNIKTKQKIGQFLEHHGPKLANYGLIQPYNVAIWASIQFKDLALTKTILSKVPPHIEYNTQTYSLLCLILKHTKSSNASPTRSFTLDTIDSAHGIAKSIIAGTSAAGSIHNTLSSQEIEDRFAANIRYKEILRYSSKEAIGRARDLNESHPDYIASLHQMVDFMYACMLCGYAIPEKEMEVTILNILNSHRLLGRLCYEKAFTIADFYLSEARPNHFKSILVFITKLCDNYHYSTFLAQLWRKHAYQLYLRFLHESHTYHLLKALEKEQYYVEICECFTLLIGSRNTIAALCLVDKDMWRLFFKSCAALQQQQTTMTTTSTSKQQQQQAYFSEPAHSHIITSFQCLSKSRRIIDLDLFGFLVKELSELERFDYIVVLLHTLFDNYSMSKERHLLSAMNGNGLSELIDILDDIYQDIEGKSKESVVFSTSSYEKDFYNAFERIYSILQTKEQQLNVASGPIKEA